MGEEGDIPEDEGREILGDDDPELAKFFAGEDFSPQAVLGVELVVDGGKGWIPTINNDDGLLQGEEPTAEHPGVKP
jgi:hypothetical protein